MFHALTFHATSSKMKGNALFFGKGVLKELSGRARRFMANSVFESVAFLRTSSATDVPDLQLHLLPVVLRLAQPGRADPAQRRPADVADRAVDADLPEEPRHPAARVGRPDGRSR